MENEEIDSQESLNPDEETVQEEETEGEDLEAIKAAKEKAEEVALNQRIRAEKAEKELKALKGQPKEKETPKTPSKEEYSLQDIRALQDVDDEDVEEIVNFSKFKNISISEAKKSPVIQALLKEKEEQKRTAQATNTGGGKRGAYKISDETILENFEKGNISEKDEDIEKLVQAQFNRKKAMLQKG